MKLLLFCSMTSDPSDTYHHTVFQSTTATSTPSKPSSPPASTATAVLPQNKRLLRLRRQAPLRDRLFKTRFAKSHRPQPTRHLQIAKVAFDQTWWPTQCRHWASRCHPWPRPLLYTNRCNHRHAGAAQRLARNFEFRRVEVSTPSLHFSLQ